MSNSSPVRIQSDDALQDQHGLSYSPALDGLRGVAILAVVGVNAEWPFLAGGFFGVDVFFVLSGFLITTLLLTEWKQRGEINLRRFFARRALRLMPALIALLAFSCIYTYFFRSPEQRGAAFTIVASALFYISNWVIGVGNVHGTLEHTWSLGVEGQFYLLGAGFIAFALRRAVGLSQMIGWCIGAIAVVVSWRAIFWEQAPGVMRVYMGLDTRADSLLIGCLVAFTRESKMGGRFLRCVAMRDGSCRLPGWFWLSASWQHLGWVSLIPISVGSRLFLWRRRSSCGLRCRSPEM